MTKEETLSSALTARNEEIENYQINLDNYRLAIEKITAEHSGDTTMDLAMQNFAEQLQGLYDSTLIEQRKAEIIRDVIAIQIAKE